MTSRVSHGRATRALTIGPYTLTEAVYRPNQRLDRHEHGWPSWTLVLQGAFDERFSHDTAQGVPGVVVTKPATADHSNVYGPAGARCLLIETRNESARFVTPRVHAAGAVPALARRIHTELESADRLARLSLEALLIELCTATDRTDRFPRVRGRQAWLNGVREQLEAEFRSPPSLAELAGPRGIHPAYLCQAFRAAFGMSLGQFVRQARYEWARVALRAGSRPLSDVALAAGYSDQAHLSREFRKRAGISPSRFRATLQD